MKESSVQTKILKYLKSIDCYTVKVISATKAGIPDIIGCYKGRFIAIECKTPTTKNNVSELQKFNIEAIHKAQGFAIVAWDVEGVKTFIESLEQWYKDRGMQI